MIMRLWRVLAPFHRTFGWFLVLITIYETVKVIEGYLNSLVVRLFESQAQDVTWIALAVFLFIYDELFMRLDNQID